MCPRGSGGAADPAVLWGGEWGEGGEATYLSVLEQDKDINYPCVSLPFEVL